MANPANFARHNQAFNSDSLQRGICFANFTPRCKPLRRQAGSVLPVNLALAKNLMTEAKKSSKDEVDLSKISSPEQLLELAGDDKLKIEQLKTLVEIHPQIVQGAIEAMQSLAKVSTIAGNSQTEAIKTIKESISGTVDILKILAQNAESDKTRERIAELLLELAKQHKELVLVTERINKNNNKLWKKIAIGIGAAATLVVGGAAAAFTLRK